MNLEDAQRAEAEARRGVTNVMRLQGKLLAFQYANELDAYAEAVRRTERVRAEAFDVTGGQPPGLYPNFGGTRPR